jgi:hypothetical protein
VLPAAEHERRTRLWSALGQAYPVDFQARDPDALRGLDGAIAFGADAGAALAAAGLPGVVVHGAETEEQNRLGIVGLASSGSLDRPLHDARLGDKHAVALAQEAVTSTDGEVLAELDGRPAWLLAGDAAKPLHHVGCAPTELAEAEALRERLAPGRCLALLALVQFLRNLDQGTDSGAVVQAAFLIDDPNLHWRSYGHLHFRKLLARARAHTHAHANGFHLSIAMVPLDGWYANRKVVELFRQNARYMSVCVHGNEHDGPELGRPGTVAEGVALGWLALARVAAFERRTGVAVDRVMVPPHERVSEAMARALAVCGFQALCTTRPYPWAVTSPRLPWLTRPAEAGPLAAWRPVDVVAGGLTVMLRADLALAPREDLVLRAFLGQPLILYGHHDLLRDGPAALTEAAAAIERLGEVRWGSLAQIASASVARTPGANPWTGPADGVSGGSGGGELAPARGQELRPLLRRLAAEGQVRAQAALTRRKDGTQLSKPAG